LCRISCLVLLRVNLASTLALFQPIFTSIGKLLLISSQSWPPFGKFYLRSANRHQHSANFSYSKPVVTDIRQILVIPGQSSPAFGKFYLYSVNRHQHSVNFSYSSQSSPTFRKFYLHSVNRHQDSANFTYIQPTITSIRQILLTSSQSSLAFGKFCWTIRILITDDQGLNFSGALQLSVWRGSPLKKWSIIPPRSWFMNRDVVSSWHWHHWPLSGNVWLAKSLGVIMASSLGHVFLTWSSPFCFTLTHFAEQRYGFAWFTL
jgi:hypothetical protein